MVRFWNPRPVFLQLNEPLNSDHPDTHPSTISAPAVVEIYDLTTGCHQESRRPRFEIGLTDPVATGPWQALKLRFRAVRSRPPQPEHLATVPANVPQSVAPRDCPGTVIVRPVRSDRVGGWQRPPLEGVLGQSLTSPNLNQYISAPVLDPPAELARVETEKVATWEPGWRQITARVYARIRPTLVQTGYTRLRSLTGGVVTWTGSTGLTLPDPTDYQVQWNPLTGSNLNAFNVSDQQVWGMGQLSSDVALSGIFGVNTSSGDNLLAEISGDDLNYGPTVAVRIPAGGAVTLYYRITISQGGLTPVGNHQVALQLEVTGVGFTVAPVVMASPDVDPPLTVEVDQISRVAPLTTLARIQVNLHGNSLLESSPFQFTDALTAGWLVHELVWYGFWSSQSIKDLHFDIQAVPIALGNDSAYVDITSFRGELTAYCPGIDALPSVPIETATAILTPTGDISVTGWSPTPLFQHLISDTDFVPADSVSVDPRLNNQFGLELGGVLPPEFGGFSRFWVRIQLELIAHANATGSTSSQLVISTDFGSEQSTPLLSETPTLYTLTWDYSPGLTTSQVNRLQVYGRAQATVIGADIALVTVRALRAILTYTDTVNPFDYGGPESPVPPGYITVLDPIGEVYSCGSLGNCSVTTGGTLVGRVQINNTTGSNITVTFVPTGRLNIRVFDLDTPTLEYPLTHVVTAGDSIQCSVLGWVGSLSDPYPVDPSGGQVIINVDDGTTVQDQFISWYYIGF